LLNKLGFHHYKHILPIGFSIVISLMVLTSLAAVMQLKVSSEIALENAEKHSEKDVLLETMGQSALKRSITLFEMLQIDDPFRIDDLYMRFNELATKFIIAKESFLKTEYDSEMQVLLDNLDVLARHTAPIQHQVYDYLQQGNKDKASKYYSEQALPKSKVLLDLVKEISKRESVHTNSVFKVSKLKNDMILSSILVFDIACILFSIFLTYYIIKNQRANERQLEVLASTDILTELPNRTSFIDSINQLIIEKPSSAFAIVFFDIDHFKSINDNYGHEVGDEVLRQFSTKINKAISSKDILARFGGDEFVLLLESIDSEEEANNFISKLSSSLDTSFIINKNEIFISSSIGITLYSQDAKTAKSLLKNADIAMYSAKEAGRNCFRFFSKETSKKMEHEHNINHALRTTLKNKNINNGELSLKYQPLLDINNGDINECEALLRWTNSEGINIPPDEFIPLAEKSNLIEKVNLFVINEACRQQLEWQEADVKNIRININLSGNKTIFNTLLNRLNKNIKKFNLNPELFGIELTERTLYEISKSTIKKLDKARKKGMKISIDDFGTEYSSLSYLKKLPITTLKIDKVFIAGLPDNSDDQALVKTIINLAHSLKLDVVAEGIETLEQLEFLKSLSCNTAQGYYLYHPLNSKQITHLKLCRLKFPNYIYKKYNYIKSAVEKKGDYSILASGQ